MGLNNDILILIEIYGANMPKSTNASSIPLLLRMVLILLWCLALSSDQDAIGGIEPTREKHKPLWKDPLWMKTALGGTESTVSLTKAPRTTILNKGQYIWIGSNTEDLKKIMHAFIENQIYGFYVDGTLKGVLKSRDRKHYRMYDMMLGWQKGAIRTIGNGDNSDEENPEFYGIVNYNAPMPPHEFKLPSTKKGVNQWLESAIAHEDKEARSKIAKHALAFKDVKSSKATAQVPAPKHA